MSILRKSFKTNLGELKVLSRNGGVNEAKVTIPQIGWDGKPLNPEAVSEQRFILESTGKNQLKLRSAYHKETPYCMYLENEIIKNKTTEVFLPLPFVHRSNIKGVIPDNVKVKGDLVQNFELNTSEEEAREINKSWAKVLKHAQLYKQRYDGQGNSYTSETKNVMQDSEGYYVESVSKYNYISLYKLGFFVAKQVNEAGIKINGTEGVYMIEGAQDEKYFIVNRALRAGSKLGIASRLLKVFRAPLFGTVQPSDMTSTGFLKKGYFRFNPIPVTVAIINSDGKIGVTLSDRRAYKLENFVAKRSRVEPITETVIDTLTTGTQAVKDELASEDSPII